MDWNLVLAMVTIHALLFLTLGPDNLLVISRTTGQGLRYGFATIAGIASAGIVQIPLVAFGLHVITSVAPDVWLLIRFLGAVYLIYIGYKILTSAASAIGSSEEGSEEPIYLAFMQGFVTNLTNPKVLVFLTAFLPQFVAVENGNTSYQLLVLGVVMKLNGFCCLTLTALLAMYAKKAVTRVLDRHGVAGLPKLVSGVSIVAVGIWMVVEPLLAAKRRLLPN